MKKLKLLYSSVVASTFSVVFIAIITIWGELAPSLKSYLKDFSGHHWVTKGIWMIILFAVVSLITFLLPHDVSDKKVKRGIVCLLWVTALSFFAILLFFIGHYNHWF